MTNIPKCSTITTKTTGNLENLSRNYASHKAPLLTLTDCLFLFSILLPSRCWDEITGDVRWKQLVPAEGQQGSCASQEWGHWAGQWCQLCTEHQAKGAFLQVCTPFLLQLELPDTHKATFTRDQCWLLWALGGKHALGGQGMRYLWNYNALVSTSTPNTARHFPQEQLPDGCWSDLVSPESGMTKDIPNQLRCAFSCGYSSFKSQLLFAETAACCESLLLLKQSLAHTLARKAKDTVFTEDFFPNWNTI